MQTGVEPRTYITKPGLMVWAWNLSTEEVAGDGVGTGARWPPSLAYWVSLDQCEKPCLKYQDVLGPGKWHLWLFSGLHIHIHKHISTHTNIYPYKHENWINRAGWFCKIIVLDFKNTSFRVSQRWDNLAPVSSASQQAHSFSWRSLPLH